MDKHVVIIGAGAAGIAAATKLISNGFRNVVVLEGQNRIGGRIQTIPCNGSVLDMGAQWCHGEKGNVVFELAKDKNLLASTTPDYSSFNFVQSNGEEIPKSVGDKLSELYTKLIYGNEHDLEKREYRGSLGNFFTEKFDLDVQRDEFKDVDFDVRREVLDWFQRMQNTVDAADSWFETSCQSIGEYWECEGIYLLNWKDRGYITLFDLLQNRIPSKTSTSSTQPSSIDIMSYIHFNKNVQKITYNTQSIDGQTSIECADGSTFVADHLICTVSLGVLKRRHLSLFEPILPTWKIVAIDGLMYGTVDKIYVEFEKSFWTIPWNGLSLLWKSAELKEVQEIEALCDWLHGVVGFFPFNCQPNMLCGWISGDAARKMEMKSDADIRIGIEKIFQLFLRRQSIPKITNIFRSKWYSNPFFYGSYSFYSLKSDAFGATTEILSKPIVNAKELPVIQFAGEATDKHYYSTVHGAVQSGWREAQRLIDLYR